MRALTQIGKSQVLKNNYDSDHDGDGDCDGGAHKDLDGDHDYDGDHYGDGFFPPHQSPIMWIQHHHHWFGGGILAFKNIILLDLKEKQRLSLS